MSILNATVPYRRTDHGSLRVPAVMPVVEVTVDAEGGLSVMLNGEPYPTDGKPHRGDLRQVLHDIAADLETPIRIELHEADQTTFTDLITPSAPSLPGKTAARAVRTARTGLGEVAGDGFTPHEQVAVAVVVAEQVASTDGTARLRLPPALLAAHPGLVVLLGQASGTVVVSGGAA